MGHISWREYGVAGTKREALVAYLDHHLIALNEVQALLAAEVGDAPRAQRKIQEAVVKGRGYQHFHHVAYAVASAYALLGKHEEAIQYLRMAADDGFPCYPLFEHDTNLDHLRNDPRFLSFLAEQKKQWDYFREHL